MSPSTHLQVVPSVAGCTPLPISGRCEAIVVLDLVLLARAAPNPARSIVHSASEQLDLASARACLEDSATAAAGFGAASATAAEQTSGWNRPLLSVPRRQQGYVFNETNSAFGGRATRFDNPARAGWEHSTTAAAATVTTSATASTAAAATTTATNGVLSPSRARTWYWRVVPVLYSIVQSVPFARQKYYAPSTTR